MKNKSLALASITLLISACEAAILGSNGCHLTLPTEVTAGGRSHNFTKFLSNSTSPPSYRAYSLTVPQDYNNSVATPLLLAFHGRGENNLVQEETSKFSDPYFNDGAIVVYPQGIDSQWQGDPQAPRTINDTLFVSELISHIEDRFCIASHQIWASGKSNGGGLVNELACNPSTSARIAAFAPVSGAFYQKSSGTCYPNRANIPILEFHGGNDTTIKYEGGEDLGDRGVTVPIPTWVQQWAQRDQCDVKNKTINLANAAGTNIANRTTWNCGTNQGADFALVSQYYSSHLGHVWPTGANAGYNATHVIMDFFSWFDLGGLGNP